MQLLPWPCPLFFSLEEALFSILLRNKSWWWLQASFFFTTVSVPHKHVDGSIYRTRKERERLRTTGKKTFFPILFFPLKRKKETAKLSRGRNRNYSYSFSLPLRQQPAARIPLSQKDVFARALSMSLSYNNNFLRQTSRLTCDSLSMGPTPTPTPSP